MTLHGKMQFWQLPAVHCFNIRHHLYLLSFFIRELFRIFRNPGYWGLYVCVYLIGTILIARKLPDEGHYHVSRANAAIMAVTVLTIVLVLSVLVKSTTIDVIGVGTANKEYIKLFRLNQIYALGACWCWRWKPFCKESFAFFRLD